MTACLKNAAFMLRALLLVAAVAAAELAQAQVVVVLVQGPVGPERVVVALAAQVPVRAGRAAGQDAVQAGLVVPVRPAVLQPRLRQNRTRQSMAR